MVPSYLTNKQKSGTKHFKMAKAEGYLTNIIVSHNINMKTFWQNIKRMFYVSSDMEIHTQNGLEKTAKYPTAEAYMLRMLYKNVF